jgi:exonuclease III
MGSKNVIYWNVCGHNSRAHHDVVRDERVSLVCLQETKMHVISDCDVVQILGSRFEYFFVPTC